MNTQGRCECETKKCLQCGALLFSDMDTCFSCMYRFGDTPSVMPSATKPDSFKADSTKTNAATSLVSKVPPLVIIPSESSVAKSKQNNVSSKLASKDSYAHHSGCDVQGYSGVMRQGDWVVRISLTESAEEVKSCVIDIAASPQSEAPPKQLGHASAAPSNISPKTRASPRSSGR